MVHLCHILCDSLYTADLRFCFRICRLFVFRCSGSYAKTMAQISFSVTLFSLHGSYNSRLYFLLLKFPAFSHLLYLYSSVCVGPVRKPYCLFSHDAAEFCQLVLCLCVYLHGTARPCNSITMQLSHLSRFDYDWYRGLNHGPIVIIVSKLIRVPSHLDVNIVIIGLIVEIIGCHHIVTN